MHTLTITFLSSFLLLNSFFGPTTSINSDNEAGGTYWFEVDRSSGSFAGIPDDSIIEPSTPIGDGILITGLLAYLYSGYKKRKS